MGPGHGGEPRWEVSPGTQHLVLMEGSQHSGQAGPRPQQAGTVLRGQAPGAWFPSAAWSHPHVGAVGSTASICPKGQARLCPTAGSGWTIREQSDIRGWPSNSKSQPSSPPCHPCFGGHREGQWMRRGLPWLAHPAWLGPHTPLSPPALRPDQEEGRDRELGMKSSGTVLLPSGGSALPVPARVTWGAGGWGRAQDADRVVC